MANRYWVGGTAAWDGAAGTKWATTSGGAGGAAVPTSADDVFFDGASGAVTCTITGTRVAKSIDCTGFTGTLAGASTPALTISGSLTFVAGMALTYAGTTTFNGTGTLTSAGKTLGPVEINGSGITTTLGDNFISSGSITVTRGTFNTGSFNVTATQLASTNSNTRTINLGSSTLTLSNTTPIVFLTNTNLIFNAGTSSIVCTNTTLTFYGGAASATGVTFYNVSFTSTTSGTRSISSGNTFNNLSVTAPSTAGVTIVTFDSRQTINGALSTTGTAGNRRVWFRSSTYGIAQTLTINSAPSLTDADFRDIYVVGTSAPIGGTRIGDLRGCRGVTFDTPKTVYWNLAGTNSWNSNAWATTPTGIPSTDNSPLAQDTATFTNAGAITQVNIFNFTGAYVGTVDMSGRTSAMTIQISTAGTVYGDWKNGSGTTITNAVPITFSGRNTQVITSAGKTFSGGIIVDSYGGSVELADALNIGSNTLTITNGTVDTKNYNVTASALSSSDSSVREIKLGSSTVTLSGGNPINFTTSTNLTFDSGTSQINLSSSSVVNAEFGGMSYYNVTYTSTALTSISITSASFNNLTITSGATASLVSVAFLSNVTINGTLTCAGATAVRRIFVRSAIVGSIGTTCTLTVNSISADNCDFRDITLAGSAAGASPTRAGDCGGNSGITFPVAKTVYWNLSGAQNWSATGWATSSGGSPAIDNFPLAQDTAVFDNTGAVTGTITINANWNIGTFDASTRTSAMTLTIGTNSPVIYGDWKFGTGVTSSSTTGTITFSKRGTQTITSNGVQFGCHVTIHCATGTVQLADALSLGATRALTLTSGTFDAVTYNVTTGLFVIDVYVAPNLRTLKMGSGVWTLTGVGTVFNFGLPSNFTLFKGTANIVLSDTSVSSRTFDGSGFSFNKLTIGGTTGVSTLTITGSNQFTELASTKTVAHTIALGTTTQTFGAWTVTGTVGNVVTVTGTATVVIAGARVTGVDYLALGTIVVSATSPGEFYAGANSTGGINVIRTAAPAAVTRYWIGGTGVWDATTTTNWAASSGGSGGASVPTSADAVIFDSASNATAYTVTCTATQLRCGSLTISGPTSGNVTWAGAAPLAIHGDVSLPATGITRSYTGSITLTGSSTGRTFTTNGVVLASAVTVNGVGCGWTLGSAIDIGSSALTVTTGSFSTGNYAVSAGSLSSSNTHSRTITLGSSTVTLASLTDTVIFTSAINLTFSAGTSSIVCSGLLSGFTFAGGEQTFNDVSFSNTSKAIHTISGANTFNNLTISGQLTASIFTLLLSNDQTVTGTLTFSAGTNATARICVFSDTIGTTRAITAAAVNMTDVDFRDITIAGAAAPASGTRIGDCRGNSGITFTVATTRYWNLAGSNDWSAIGWAASSGASPAVNNFPLAQDTCVFEAGSPGTGTTTTINASYNIGTIDMSARTTNTMTLAVGSTTPAIYGNWINGTGTTITGAGILTFAGRTTQQLTSAGGTFTTQFTFRSPSGTVTLQDAFSSSNSNGNALRFDVGTFDANTYNVTLSGALSGVNSAAVTTAKTIAIGSGTWAVAGSNGWTANTTATVTGTGTISLTSASAKTFAGGGIAYTNITLNQGGAGAMTITGNNTFKGITNTYKATGATTISFGTATQRVSQWTAAGEAGRLLTINGSSASSPCTLVHTGVGDINVDYLVITGVRAYPLS